MRNLFFSPTGAGRWLAGGLLGLLLLAAAPKARATTYYVETGGSDAAGRDGLSKAAAWASLAYACEQVPAGSHFILLGTGTFTATRTAYPKAGVTVRGQGLANTTVQGAASWVMDGTPSAQKPANYLLAINDFDNITIEQLTLASASTSSRIHGGIWNKYSDYININNCRFAEFAWTGAFFREVSKLELRNCQFLNASQTFDGYHNGCLQTRYLGNSTIHDNSFKITEGRGYGYKASGHENVQFYNNTIDVLGEFALESAHENEYGFEVHHNTMNAAISVPKGDGGDNPNNRNFTYSVWIHHNTLGDSYGVEGPRSYLVISDNYFNLQRTGGRLYAQFGGYTTGPINIHHNVIVNLDRGFIWKDRGQLENLYVYNNTIYCADAGDRTAAIMDAGGSDGDKVVKNWQFKNNIVVAPASKPRQLYYDNVQSKSAITATNNLLVNITGAPAGNSTGQDPGLKLSGAAPSPYYAPAGATSAVVDAGTNVGFAYKGTAPDIGAYEFDPATAGPAAGSGTGLLGQYFPNRTLSSPAALTRTDAQVNFNWGNGSPASGTIGTDNFSVRWEGQVQAQYSETYTFSTLSDDGVRLWVNGQQLVSNWSDHGPTTNTGTIALVAGQKYSIKMEYYENGGGAVAQLSWASPSRGKQFIPQSQLYPASAGPLAEGWYVLLPECAQSNRLTVTGNSTSLGTNLQMEVANSSDAQKWQATRLPDGSYRFTSALGSNRVLDVSGASSAAGANVHLWEWLDNAAQHWTLQQVGTSDYFTLQPQCGPANRLDVAGASSAAGTNVMTWTNNGNAAQHWRFVATTPTAAALGNIVTATATAATAAGLQLYPNPARGSVMIEATAALREVAIYNALGQRSRLIMGNKNGRPLAVSLNGLAAGVYSVQATTTTGQQLRQWLVVE